MTSPIVCAVMLTADRPAMARRAVECFRAQTYENKYLLAWDSGSVPAGIEAHDDELWIRETPCSATIGNLRNSANRVAFGGSENIVLVNWDDDDWSHPNRIAEQVALLQWSRADVVGYNEMLFWREAEAPGSARVELNSGEAWLYSNPEPNYCLGTSLCYWREAWERKPFDATSQGEDTRFISGLKSLGVSSLEWKQHLVDGMPFETVIQNDPKGEPRMVASIHAGNTSNAYKSFAGKSEWRRVPEWDAHCRSTMEVK